MAEDFRISENPLFQQALSAEVAHIKRVFANQNLAFASSNLGDYEALFEEKAGITKSQVCLAPSEQLLRDICPILSEGLCIGLQTCPSYARASACPPTAAKSRKPESDPRLSLRLC
jgi:hypothetical protein